MSEQPKDIDAEMRDYLDAELVEAGSKEAPALQSVMRGQEAQPHNGEAPVAVGSEVTPQSFRDAIAGIASTVLKIPPDRLDARENMSRYGVDSIIVTEIMKRISDLLDLPIAPTVFFEAKHLEELADILYRRYAGNVAHRSSGDVGIGAPAAEAVTAVASADAEIDADVMRWIAEFRTIAASGHVQDQPVDIPPQAEPGYEPVAIIGMEGIFPESANLEEFEKHLRAGNDCIREVPADRWDWRQVFGDPQQGEFTNVKYGGFAPDIDKFDPLFFGMSPKEAELMDPQHRLFIQCVWKLIESAGYDPRSLSGRKVGMFIGINLQDYAHLIDRSGAMEALHLTSLGHMFCPNRLSFLLDLHGPSQVIDTACSSSLVALHRAVLSIQHEGCEMAVAGGANLLISPDMHVMFSKVGMICEDGRCKTFSPRANGYVRSDGVGAVLLKPLSQAERDGDTILAVVRGSAENHGGMSTSLTAPNPKAQASLIVEAHRKAGVDPRSIGYIECHGTGTSLGDPIEINGLRMAFEELYHGAGVAMPDAPTCGLGSVKSNIGHAETAAGIAGVIKAVLALRNRQLYATLHCADINPMIELDGSPFFILQQGKAWQRPVIDGREQPRRAGVSSFGAGGSNAHVVIEEYVGKPQVAVQKAAPALILLSARDGVRLGELVGNLRRFLGEFPDTETLDIADIAYTLQVGREAMAERRALVVESVADLKAKLDRIAEGGASVPESWTGRVKRGEDGSPNEIRQCFAEGDLRRLAALWTRGVRIDWQALYAETEFSGRRPRRVRLPTYPFEKRRCWLPDGPAQPRRRRGTDSGAALHPLAQRNTSDLSEQRFSSTFAGTEFFLADHVVMGERVLPGVAYLEMARAAVRLARPEADRRWAGLRLKDVVWARPFAVGDGPAVLHIGLHPQQDGAVACRIYSRPDDPDGEPVLHAQGTAVLQDDTGAADRLDLAALRATITQALSAARCYEAFAAMGIAYGPGHRCLDTVYFSTPEPGTAPPQVLAKLALPKGDPAPFVLHPGLMDAALQACIGLVAGAGHALTGRAAALPFALESFELVAQPPAVLWAWIRYADGSAPSDRVQKLDIDLADDEGRICVRMRGFSSRTPEPPQAAETAATLIFRPVWVDKPAAGTDTTWPEHRVVLCAPGGAWPESVEREIVERIPGALCLRLRLDGGIADAYATAAASVLDVVREAFARKDAGRTLIQVAVPARGDAALLAGLSGLLRTANRESERVLAQLVELEAAEAADAIAARLHAESGSGQAHVRYDGTARRVLEWQEFDSAGHRPAVLWKNGGVYLVTGGAGGLGRLFAHEIAGRARGARVILCGRTEPGAAQREAIERLSSAGLDVRYRQADVGRREDVDALVAEAMQAFGRIDGVLHCAGVLRDNFISGKTDAEFGEVLAPKVGGTVHLDAATAALDLDFFALFASAAGALGSAGQADYAAANAFMDAFARHRNALVRAGQRRGHTVSIDWPLWAEGGMRMEPAALAMMRAATGLEPLPRDAGIRAFDDIMASGEPQVLVMHGAPARIRRSLTAPQEAAQAPHRTGEAGGDGARPADASELRAGIERMLLRAVANAMKFEPHDLDTDTEWSDYGFDSITLTEFSNRLNREYRLELTPTAFFEHSTIAALAGWLAAGHGPALAEALGLNARPLPEARAERDEATQIPAAPPLVRFGNATERSEPQKTTDNAVAIIGMSGRFPMARDLDEFWENLVAGKDCISEIPPDRWDWKALYSDPASGANRTDVKWGGFIDGIGDFDARFFGISPREAELMDPQQRLLMQYAWKAIEDAGYSASSLAGTNTAIIVGTAPTGYGDLVARSGAAIESYSSTGTVGSIGPNRMSYFLNVHGPSETVETACSSALVAIHRALIAMANGDCDQAIVGGINLIVSPETHISFNKAGMLSPDGRCKTFSKDANGYARGEGVGMLFLKRLRAAERAGDHIYGVIRGSAENHGGRGNSLTAPNPKAQAELLKTAYTRAGVDPRTVGYIEAHGTGTALGDPIEITGLKTAFHDLYLATGTPEVTAPHCGLGSVKTNIGHLELAAGVAGVIKVLLQLKHKTLVRSLHCDEVNPYIQLQASPFYLVRENREWTPLRDCDGRALPRRAGVSSYGFGGVNAHVVIEEYPKAQGEAEPASSNDALPALVVLSAKNGDRLKAYAAALLSFIEKESGAAGIDADADRAQRVLSDRACSLVSDILQVDRGEIAPEHPLDEYGFDPVHRTMLREGLQDAFGMEIGAAAFFRNHTVASIAADVLKDAPALRDRLGGEDAPPETEPDALNLREWEPGSGDGLDLADLAYTLQVGREPMGERLALIAHSVEDLGGKLRAFVEDRSAAEPDLFTGSVGESKGVLAAFGADEELQEAVGTWMRRGKFSRLLDLWAKGLNIDWDRLYGESGPYRRRPRRISAPGYPFAEQRYWIEARPPAAAPAAELIASAALHPLLHENVSSLRQVRFGTLLTGTEFFLADHKVQGRKVLPGVAYLEMARAALAHAATDAPPLGAVVRLRDVVWIAPAVVDRPRRIGVDLTPDAHGAVRYEISSAATEEAGRSDRQVHSQGIAALVPASRPPNLDPAALLAQSGMTRIDAAQCYALFGAAGLDYGPGHRGIAELHVGDGEVLARLVLPESVANTLDQYVLHPSLMDSALQASIGLVMGGLVMGAGSATPDGGAKLSLPFAVEAVDVFGACTASMWARVRRRAGGAAGERLQKVDIDLCDEGGQVCVRIEGFSSRLLDADRTTREPEPPGVIADRPSPSSFDAAELRARTIGYFKELLSSALKFPIDEIRADEALESYGIDSMMVMELTGILEKPFGDLPKTLFFEYQTLAELVDHFLVAYRPQLLTLFDARTPAAPPTAYARSADAAPPPAPAAPPAFPEAAEIPIAPARPDPGALDIAIIGLSGQYPQSWNIEAFWRNLRDGRDCITEVPDSRWDWRAYYSTDRSQPGRHYCKWGGFIEDADRFDPLFFNISPSAAEYMDPQERLFLEHAWTAMEDAGYRREDLQRPHHGSADDDDMPAQVGVYAGVMYGEYQMLGLEAARSGKGIAAANFYASIANRVSYALNLHGPSMAVDTMCSSALTAIHLACQDLKLGNTDYAFAGGVNLNVHPNKYSVLSLGQFISSTGKCESFGAGGDGYVPSEGVGVVLLKRLADAERDGDHIYGVIRGSALNHGGKTNGYSVPNPKAQQMVIGRAVRDAGIDPRAIGYIEAHGTGTKLGDPIEIAGLVRALDKHVAAGQTCWIGSSKSNIGHSEAAAGIAGLTKVLLQMREGKIAPSLHADSLNPNIDFPATPFRVNRELRDWPRPVIDGRPHRRVAGISSFGAGGANAHLIVEEYVGADSGTSTSPVPAEAPAVVVLSARTEPQLREYAENLLRFVRDRHAETNGDLPLRDLAYTLQVGREAMAQRLGFLAVTADEVADRLERFLRGDHGGLHLGRARPGRAPDTADPDASAALIRERRHDELLARWVAGTEIDWHGFYADADRPPSRISLPTYPFARERYWLDVNPSALPFPESRPSAIAVAEASALPQDGEPGILTIRPVWIAQAIRRKSAGADYKEHRVLSLGGLPEIPCAACIPLRSAGSAADRRFTDYAIQVFEQIRDIFGRKPAGPVLLQVVIGAGDHPTDCPDPLPGALAAMLKTARMENPQLVGQVIELDAAAARRSPAELAALLRDNGEAPADPHVRYRQGRREVPAWTELEEPPQSAPPVWRQGGTYLITGGAGGLGLIFAREIARQVADATLILTGRSPLDDARGASLDALRATGARVEYRAVDVADGAAVSDLIGSIHGLNGIIHSAGVIRDGFILRKSAAELRDVLAAKVSGTINLDLASRTVDLDFLVLFSSLAGAVGNPGQSDYATANAFMDAYAAYRNALVAGVVAEQAMLRPKGRTLSIDWPLWQHGGMGIDDRSKEAMWRATGLRPLATEAGITAFYRGLASGDDRIMVLQGDVPRLRSLFLEGEPAPAAPEGPPAARGASEEKLAVRAQGMVLEMVSDTLKLPVHRIEADVPLEQYGIDSVVMMKLTNDLEKHLGPLPKTLFFEHPTVESVGAWLAASFAPQLAVLFDPEPAPAPSADVPEEPTAPRAPLATEAEMDIAPAVVAQVAASAGSRDIAVIGMSGRFPKAEDLDQFWRNLAEGRDCITEVPAERWDHDLYFDPDKSRIGKTACKWGGFLDGVDRFDAAFFRIPPGEAALLDPQERLFLETVWNLLESAGYLGETLQRLCRSQVGVFAGSMSQQYHAFESDLARESIVAMSSPSSIANRVSYFFDFQGPSLAIDTMCSSALVAVHMACESLMKGECKVAVAGGVNLTIHPKKYVGLAAGQMLGSNPDSTSFGDGDGYLPAEGVGAVLLKPLGDAIADGDEILAVVKSTAINHGGRSNGYRVPSGSAQADLIAGNFARAGIDPRTVSYVESAANGSPLGDAIELGALAEGFRRYTGDRQFCAIGSVKSNIGHAEAASGMSQLIKTVLQLRHRQLAPTIKAQPLNPNIDFAPTPFYLQRRLEDWRRPVVAVDGGAPCEYPRRATVSSFGAGGSNAHLIVEEYAPADQPAAAPEPAEEPQLVLLSARTAPQLDALVRRMLAFVEQRPELSIEDLAYTLQTARDAMDHRLALVVEGRDGLIEGLRAWLRKDGGAGGAARIFSGNCEEDHSDIRQLLAGSTGRAMRDMLLAERDLEKLALYWVKGARIAWQPMHDGRNPRRIALPTYPFDRQSHWLAEVSAPDGVPETASDGAGWFAVDARISVRDNMERYLVQGIARLLGLPAETVRASGRFHDLGVDSLSLIRLRQGLEQVFGVNVSARDALDCPTPAALAELAAARRPAADTAADAVSDPIVEFPGGMSPLSEGQKGLWLLHQMAPEMSAYNVPIALRFGSGLDIGLLRQACAHMLERFPILASVFVRHDGEIYRRQAEDARLHFAHARIDETAEAAIGDLLRAKSKEPFDLAHGPLFRVDVLTPASGAVHYVLLTVHHIVFDGSSAVLLTKALMETYRALAAGNAPALPEAQAEYGDFVRWQRDFLASERAAAQLDYWRAQLAGEPAAVSLPYDYPRPARQSFDGAAHEAVLAPELARKIRALANTLGVTPSVIFLGALDLLLHRYSDAGDVVVGMPTSGRPEGRFDGAVGYFVNMIAVRSQISGQQPVAAFLRDLQRTLADGLDHADVPFPAVLEALRNGVAQTEAALFQVVFGYQNFIQPGDVAEMRDAAQDLSMELLPDVGQEGTHDLALEVYQGADGFRLKMDYDTALFVPDTIRRAMGHYVHLLESMTSRPDAPVADHGLLSADERRQIAEWGAGGAGHEMDCGIVELFRRQARLTPDAAALVCEGRSLGYQELDRRSAQLARLLRARGVEPGDRVGVCMGRGLDMIVALLAIWKAGAVYVPIAPDQPEPRIRHVIEDSQMKLLIADANTRDRMAAPDCLTMDDLERDAADIGDDQEVPVPPEAAAYVIYTSGSTGTPKGVVIPHRAIAHHCRVMRDYYGLTPDDRVLQFAAMSVDASLEQVLPGLLCGAAVAVRSDALWSAQAFRRKIAELGITVIDVPPSYLHELLLDTRDAADWAALASLRLAITGGEALRPDTVALWRASPMRTCRLVNAYGPTETTVTSTVFEIGPDMADAELAGGVPIGRPLPGESVHILDGYGQRVPVGVPGELHIGGAGLALGYLNRPELTRAAFVEDPAEPGSRLYRTGDLARWRADGTVAFLGRRDHQVKVRGFRVECGEVEAALRELDGVAQVVVLARPVNGSEQLVAFVICAEGARDGARDFRRALSEMLPDHMIPAVFVPLARLPVTPGGKVDRTALLHRDLDVSDVRDHVAPRTALEARLAGLWRQVLNVERIGVHDSFFDLGGHSLLAVRLAALIHKELGQDLPISSLFEASDIARQAQILERGERGGSPLVCLRPGGDEAPLFLIHAVAGTVLCYRDLSRSMGGGRPVYALQAPDTRAHPGTVEGLAALYIEAIRSVQPRGPYRLGGWSMGGVIAYEMARQLRATGERVARLALIDSYTPAAVKALEPLGADDETRLSTAFARELGLDPATAPHPMVATFKANVQAMDRYTPAPYRGSATLFAAGPDQVPEDTRYGDWSKLIGGALTIVPVPGDHDSILRQPDVQHLSNELTRYIDEKTD